ncbi:MAG: PepSY domain-containing protein [Pseudomonadota bacterium]
MSRIQYMRGIRLLFSMLVLCLSSTVSAMPVAGNPGEPLPETPSIVDETFADKVTLEQAVRRVRKQYGGRIVSAETRGRGADRVHVIKVLTDSGRVHTVRINAN